MCCLLFHNLSQRLLCWLVGILVFFTAESIFAERSAKPVQVIVPFSAGGGSDTLARFLVREINASELDDAPWVVINIPGAGGTVGSRHAKNSLPNGRTVLFLHDGILTAKLSGKATYGPEFFEPIAMTGKVGMVMAVKDDSNFTSLPELLEAATETPDSITFAANLGAPSFYLGKLIESCHPSARFRYVQSGGGARRFADITGGHIQVTVFSVSEFLSFQEGGLKGLAYFGENRHPSLPDVPTAKESDIEVVYENLQGWWTPLRTPPQEVDRLGDVLERAFHSSSVEDALSKLSIDADYLTADAFAHEILKKTQNLQQIPFSVDVRRPPRLEWILLPLVGLLTFVLLRRRSREPRPPKEEGSIPIRRSIAIAFLLIGYLLTLFLTEGLFLWASSAFLFLLLIQFPISPRKSLLLLIPSFAVPLLLILFIERLLGLPLP